MAVYNVPGTGVRSALVVTAQGFIAESDRRFSYTAQTTPTSGTIFGTPVGLFTTDTVTNVHFAVTTAGAGTAPTLIKGALLDKTGKVLGVSADLSANAMWTSTGVPTIPLGAPVTPAANDLYYACFLKVGAFGTTDIQLVRNAVAAAASGTALTGKATAWVAETGKADFPAVNSTLTLGGTPGAVTALWGAVS